MPLCCWTSSPAGRNVSRIARPTAATATPSAWASSTVRSNTVSAWRRVMTSEWPGMPPIVIGQTSVRVRSSSTTTAGGPCSPWPPAMSSQNEHDSRTGTTKPPARTAPGPTDATRSFSAAVARVARAPASAAGSPARSASSRRHSSSVSTIGRRRYRATRGRS
jgi:hypothetical protein